MQPPEPPTGPPSPSRARWWALAIIAAVLLVLTWALTTLFEITIAKALALVVLLVFFLAAGALLLGLGP